MLVNVENINLKTKEITIVETESNTKFNISLTDDINTLSSILYILSSEDNTDKIKFKFDVDKNELVLEENDSIIYFGIDEVE